MIVTLLLSMTKFRFAQTKYHFHKTKFCLTKCEILFYEANFRPASVKLRTEISTLPRTFVSVPYFTREIPPLFRLNSRISFLYSTSTLGDKILPYFFRTLSKILTFRVNNQCNKVISWGCEVFPLYCAFVVCAVTDSYLRQQQSTSKF